MVTVQNDKNVGFKIDIHFVQVKQKKWCVGKNKFSVEAGAKVQEKIDAKDGIRITVIMSRKQIIYQ